jgi:ubiquinone/menaquinone biosynthesis C-methylase UbiE
MGFTILLAMNADTSEGHARARSVGSIGRGHPHGDTHRFGAIFLRVHPANPTSLDDVTSEVTNRGESAPVAGYFETRLSFDPNRVKVWKHICAYLARWITPDAAVLELGAGWCDLANNVTAARVVAMDLDPIVTRTAAPHVTPIVGDCTDLSQFDTATFDVVFASNLLEHLHRPVTNQMLTEVRRVLRPGGRLILMQPNFRLNPGRYFDDFTHVSIFTDQSLPDYLVSEGFAIQTTLARFLPLTMKSRGSHLTFLIPWYLRSPIKPLAGQMLIVATPTTTAPTTTGAATPTGGR